MSERDNELTELKGLKVTIDRVEHQPMMSTPPDRPHCFAYHVTIHNNSSATVKIVGRKWVVRDQLGEVTAVEGDGVVGQFPLLTPGESFSYHSYHIFDTEQAIARGSYLGQTEDGKRVVVRIPEFTMKVRET